ncbi:MAG: hypothetical protein AAF799_34745 [Myxococcota bacterium]
MRLFSLRTFIPSVLAVGLMACNAYRLEPPAGFAEVEQGYDGAHMKANNDVGLRVHVRHNVRGGTLAFWSLDLVEKLGERGYTLVNQAPLRSKNRVAGTRFDFEYTPVGEGEAPRFYTVSLFVTDEHRVVMGMAGKQEYAAEYLARVDEIVGDLKVSGCKPFSKICKGPQPARLSTASQQSAKAEPAEAKAEPAAG